MLDKAAPLAPIRPRENLLSRLDKAGVGFCLNSRVCEIHPDGIRYEQNGETKEMTGFDSIVLAFGSRSDKALETEYEGDHRIHSVGDCLTAGDAKKGIYEATKLAMVL